MKKPLPMDVMGDWPLLHYSALSSSGEYIAYRIYSKKSDTTWLQATGRDWKRGLKDIKSVSFSSDGQMFIFLSTNDNLGIWDLTKDSISYYASVNNFKLPRGENSSWIGIFFKNPADSLILLNLNTGVKKSYTCVSSYSFDDDGSNIILQTTDEKIRNQERLITWLNLTNGKSAKVADWLNLTDGLSSKVTETRAIGNFVFDSAKTQLAFLAEVRTNGKSEKVLKYYRKGMDSAVTIADSRTKGLNGSEISNGRILFCKSGDRLFFTIEKQNPLHLIRPQYDSCSPEISDYKSEVTPEPGHYNKSALAVIDLSRPQTALRLEENNDFLSSLNEKSNGDYLLTASTLTRLNEKTFGAYDVNRADLFLTDTRTGIRKLLKSNLILDYAEFSENGNFAIWYNRETGKWESYCLSNGHTKNITPGMFKIFRGDNDRELAACDGIAGWTENDQSVFIYDRYDIWRVDPKGTTPPVNITGGFGYRNNIRFRIKSFAKGLISVHDTLLLTSMNNNTKETGFFSVVPAILNSLVKLSSGNKIFYFGNDLAYPNINGIAFSSLLVKAKTASKYFLVCEDYNKYPNLYFTKDFKDYKPLTNLAPQNDYLWYSAELMHFSLPDGLKTTAILYKPEDFNPKKMYPVIFYYYEKNTNGLHMFLHPELSNGCLNIPWFVSNDFIVCVPDMVYFKYGHPGESAFLIVNEAANALCRMAWIDSLRMGLQGHSYGAWETNFILTRTNRFAAAASASGFSDLVSLNSEYSGSQGEYFESGQGRLYARFSDNPELYIENSPIFKVGKVNSPVLIMHTKKDSRVPYLQGKEWYNALTRTHKKIWLLSYENDNHVLENEKNRLDYSMRLGQFFNYYLKSAFPPRWMTKNMNASAPCSDDEFELDTSGKKP